MDYIQKKKRKTIAFGLRLTGWVMRPSGYHLDNLNHKIGMKLRNVERSCPPPVNPKVELQREHPSFEPLGLDETERRICLRGTGSIYDWCILLSFFVVFLLRLLPSITNEGFCWGPFIWRVSEELRHSSALFFWKPKPSSRCIVAHLTLLLFVTDGIEQSIALSYSDSWGWGCWRDCHLLSACNFSLFDTNMVPFGLELFS